MTNLEFYKDEICKGVIFCKMAHILHYGKHCGTKSCVCCGFRNIDKKGVDKCIDLLLAEHKEPIKLTKFEYDLLKCYQETKDDGEFEDHYILKEMQYKGHFQNVDYNLTIEEILDNCEVTEDE